MSGWSLVYEGFDPAQERLRETLCTLGNGYFATRGAAAESAGDEVHYPGTYLAGCYNRLPSVIDGTTLEHEDLVNAPNWLPLTFRCPGDPWLDLASVTVLAYRQELDLRRGVLVRDMRVRDAAGRTTRVQSERLVHMATPHLAALRTTITPEDWSGPLEIRAALDGREETDTQFFNPRSGRWMADHSHLQRHVGAAIAYNVWQYHEVTGDLEFLVDYGAEMLLEMARFWASATTYDPRLERYEIRGVMGPDEYHDRYPGADRFGLNNNAYTNVLAVWVLVHARAVLDIVPTNVRRRLVDRLAITESELAEWEAISRRMRLVFHTDGVLSQFEGYEGLKEFDWEAYRRRYAHLYRLDFILESEGDSTIHYKLSKQPDVLMLFYLFSAGELRSLFERLGYPFDEQTIPRNIAYYYPRSAHDSSLSRVADTWVLARADRPGSWDVFMEALMTDVVDIQGGTTPEGIHLGAMAGTVDILQRCYTGIELRGDVLWLRPRLPKALRRLRLSVRYRGHSLDLELTGDAVEVSTMHCCAPSIRVAVNDETYDLAASERRRFPLR